VNEPGARTGEAAALGQDLIDLADALGIGVLNVVGHDWGSRAGHAAAIHFQREWLGGGIEPTNLFLPLVSV
jgi:pimeloyl-ACP methyl ester carboxylesterase